MDTKKLLFAGGLIGIFIVFFISLSFITFQLSDNLLNSVENSDPWSSEENPVPHFQEYLFNNSTPEATAVSVARLNLGEWGFDYGVIKSANLTLDGKYWEVEIYASVYQDEFEVITIDAKTWESKVDGGEWKSLDELKASYIAEIQSSSTQFISENPQGKPQKINIDGKTIWKVPVNTYDFEKSTEKVEFVYVDLATGKSKNTCKEFNNAAGTDGWLTLKEVDQVIDKMYNWIGFRDALRDLYPE